MTNNNGNNEGKIGGVGSASAAATAIPESDKQRLAAARKHAIARRETDRKGAERSRSEVPGGIRLKMSVAGEIPGYHLYWENDQDGSIEQLLMEGFDFVSHTELQKQEAVAIVADSEISSQISRFVGTKEDGTPLRAYLMKCPDEIWREREAQRYQQADAWDADIRRQADAPASGLRKLNGVKTSIDTQFRKEY